MPQHRMSWLTGDRHAIPGIREKMVTQDGVVRIIKTQDAQPMFAAIRAAKELPQGPNMRYVGSVPLLLAQAWAKECGFAIGTKGFQEHCKKKLMSGDYAKLRGE